MPTTEEISHIEWPARLRSSADLLCSASQSMKEMLLDERRFSLLIDDTKSNVEFKEVSQEYRRLLSTALSALTDLTGYDNPERPFPDLSEWYRFECPNVTFGEYKIELVHYGDRRIPLPIRIQALWQKFVLRFVWTRR